MTRIHALLILLLVAPAAFAQEALPQGIEQRLRELEAKASRVDGLEAKVQTLETRLLDYEQDEADDLLEQSINGLLVQTKPVNVSARKASWLTVGGQLRIRSEYRTVNVYNNPDPKSTDEDWTVQRTRVNFDARVADNIRIFVEIQDSRLWGEEMSVVTDLEGVDLHQGYMDIEQIFGTPLTVRSGRFEMKLWNQRLISPLDWHPVGRAWDGIMFFGDLSEQWWVMGGYQKVSEDPAIDSDHDTDFYEAVVQFNGIENHTLGAAFFWLHSAPPGPMDLSFGTVTAHFDGKSGGFDYSADLVAQFGDNGDLDVKAYAAAAEIGYTLDHEWKPRFAVEWTYATGDSDPTDGDFETFNPLFPFGHAYQGFLDLFAWKNGHDLAFRIQGKPDPKWWLQLAVHGFWLDESSDAWYNAAGKPIRPATSLVSDDDIGWEIDFSVKHWVTENVVLWFGYSHFFPGDYVDATGRDPSTDWLWFQVTANF